MRLTRVFRCAALGLTLGCIDGPAEEKLFPVVEDDAVGTDGADAADAADGAADGADAADGSELPPVVAACEMLKRAPTTPANFVPGSPGKAAAMFATDTVPTFALSFTAADWDAYLATWNDPKWETESGTAVEEAWAAAQGDAYVPCTFTFEGQSTAAMCRPRGSPEYWKNEYKPEIRIKFDEVDENARFLGLRAVALESAPFTVAPVRDRVAAWFFEQVGLPAARVNNVRLQLTIAADEGGQPVDYGVYQNLEVVDREFLERWYPDPDGYLYEGGWDRKTNKSDPANDCDWMIGDLLAAELPGSGDHSAFFETLGAVFDVPLAVKVMAAEVVFPSIDNLTNGSSNYYWYLPPGGPMRTIPVDFDHILSWESEGDDGVPYDQTDLFEFRAADARLRTRMNENPTWRARFVEHLQTFVDGPFAQLPGQIDAACAQIRGQFVGEAERYWPTDKPALPSDWPAGLLQDFDRDCEEMRAFAERRLEFVKAALQAEGG